MTKTGYPLAEAHNALDEFLGDLERGEPTPRWIGDTANGGPVIVHFVPDVLWREVMEAYLAQAESREVSSTEAAPPAASPQWQQLALWDD